MLIDFETKALLQILEGNFSLFRDRQEHIQWDRLLCRTSNNRVLYELAASVLTNEKMLLNDSLKKALNQIKEEGENALQKLNTTIKFIKRNLENYSIPFLIVKTFKLRPYVTWDVDLLLKKEDVNRTLEVFKSDGAKIKYFKPKRQWDVTREDLLRIDTHTGFRWQESTFLDDALLWKNPRKVKVGEETYSVPNLEVEVSTVILNIIYESYHITLLDFLLIKDTTSRVNWEQVYEQSVKYGWSGAFIIFVQIFHGLMDSLYSSNADCKIKFLGTSKRVKFSVPVSMPYIFSWSQGMSIITERIYKRRYFPAHDLAYFIFAKTRYHLTRGRRVPMYYHWFPLETLKWDR